MIEAIVLFLLGIGALLVSIASILRMARPRLARRAVDRAMRAEKTDTRMAA